MDNEHDRLLMVVRDAWLLMDASELIKSLDPSFIYDSPPTKRRVSFSDYPWYITKKFRDLSAMDMVVNATIVPDTKSHNNMIRLHGESPNGTTQTAFIRIKVFGDRITRLTMEDD